ncbi:hypothetical protein GOODEAATRI_003655, partial [Goodea atripinnis]
MTCLLSVYFDPCNPVTQTLTDLYHLCTTPLKAFDMQRDLQITPRRLEYTREKEGELFNSLMAIANRKQEEMKEMIVETLSSMKEQLLEDAANLEFTGQVPPGCSHFYAEAGAAEPLLHKAAIQMNGFKITAEPEPSVKEGRRLSDPLSQDLSGSKLN